MFDYTWYNLGLRHDLNSLAVLYSLFWYLIARARFVSDARQILLRRIQRVSNDSLRKKKDTIRVTSVQGKILSFTLSSSEKTSSELDFEI